MAASNPDHVIKTGWAIKQGGSHKNWKKRYFVLNKVDETLCYFKKETDVEATGTINVAQCSLEMDWLTFDSKPNTLQIYNPERGTKEEGLEERAYPISFETIESMWEWIDKIQTVRNNYLRTANNAARIDFTITGDVMSAVVADQNAWIAKSESAKQEDIVQKKYGQDTLVLEIIGNPSDEPAAVTFAKPYPGKIMEIDLAQHWFGSILVQRGAFLCCSEGTDVSIAVRRDDVCFLRFVGGGNILLQTGGSAFLVQLQKNKTLEVNDMRSVVALEGSINISIDSDRPTQTGTAVKLHGPGKVYLQTIPFRKFAQALVPTMMHIRR